MLLEEKCIYPKILKPPLFHNFPSVQVLFFVDFYLIFFTQPLLLKKNYNHLFVIDNYLPILPCIYASVVTQKKIVQLIVVNNESSLCVIFCFPKTHSSKFTNKIDLKSCVLFYYIYRQFKVNVFKFLYLFS